MWVLGRGALSAESKIKTKTVSTVRWYVKNMFIWFGRADTILIVEAAKKRNWKAFLYSMQLLKYIILLHRIWSQHCVQVLSDSLFCYVLLPRSQTFL